MTFAETLRRLRAEHYLTQAELAEKAELGVLTVHRLETGRSQPTLRSLRNLAKALGVQVSDLARPDEVVDRKKLTARAA
jgi:transcriptional regulator with XRE-family HTH domain